MPAGDNGDSEMSKERELYAAQLEAERKVGVVSEQVMRKELANFDALEATKVMPIYALVSTIVAAISAIASAAAAYFAYAALHVPH
jgi:hypothetical protein